MKPINIAIADDYAVYREGLTVTLSQDPVFNVLFEADNGRELLEQMVHIQPDLVLMDYKMPEMDGMAATRQIKALYPDVKILVISMYEDEQFIRRLQENGADGYLLKNAEPGDIRKTILSLMGY